MVRNPCCEKMGLKRGPWTSDEDLILVDFVNRYGHDNWRALPKRAGLLRCGKSCRLRWMNYLRPGIKRGNFTIEEEEHIIRLHQELGNRWSVIASRLPGRTDNEIKNIWHTNLKKKIKKVSHPKPEVQPHKPELSQNVNEGSNTNSPLNSSNGLSSVDSKCDDLTNDSFGQFPEIDESFWSDDFSTGKSDYVFQSSLNDTTFDSDDLSLLSGFDFWTEKLTGEQDLVELLEFW